MGFEATILSPGQSTDHHNTGASTELNPFLHCDLLECLTYMFQFFFLLKLDPVNTLGQTIHLVDLTELLLNGQHLL